MRCRAHVGLASRMETTAIVVENGTLDDVTLPFDILNDVLVPVDLSRLPDVSGEDSYEYLSWLAAEKDFGMGLVLPPAETVKPQATVTVIPPAEEVAGTHGTVSPMSADDWGENSENLAALMAAGRPAKGPLRKKKMSSAALQEYSAKLQHDNTFKRQAISTATSRLKVLREQIALIWKHEQRHACTSTKGTLVLAKE